MDKKVTEETATEIDYDLFQKMFDLSEVDHVNWEWEFINKGTERIVKYNFTFKDKKVNNLYVVQSKMIQMYVEIYKHLMDQYLKIAEVLRDNVRQASINAIHYGRKADDLSKSMKISDSINNKKN